MKRIYIIFLFAIVLTSAMAQRNFVHPGISYTQADIDRMKAMVEAKQEPYYSTFVALKNGPYSSYSTRDRGTQIKEGQFNNTVGNDGRRAHDLALLYRITGERTYADQAISALNASSYYTNTSSRGTGPLDNGKINMLIEAAELMRDYEGWATADQQRFKDMLVYPGYSTTVDYYKKQASSDDSKNAITFYWNCYNFDSGRFGNQGMFAARALLAMGIYLDNDTIFDRAYQYLIGKQEKHFENYPDLPYNPGPRRAKGSTSDNINQYLYSAGSSVTCVPTTDASYTENYGYDEQLQYYIFKNGQCQESCRDQGHTLCGIMMYAHLAEMCWSQGEDLYGALDNRILKGIEYNFRVNLTALADYSDYCTDKDWTSGWKPKAYSVQTPTVEWNPLSNTDLKNNVEPLSVDTFYQTWSRSGRWFYKDLTTADAGDKLGSSGCREMAYAHYAVRLARPESETVWLNRYLNYLYKKYTVENWGMDSGHCYEWCGWGTLSKHREPWMVGDPVSYESGKRVMGMHQVFETIPAVNFDYFTGNGNGHTYYDSTPSTATCYRTDEQVDIAEGDGGYVVTDLTSGEWLSYTFAIPDGTTPYTLTLRYAAGANSPMVDVYIDNTAIESIFTTPTNGAFVETKLTGLSLTAGVHVLRLVVQGDDADLRLSTLRFSSNAPTYAIVYSEGMTGLTEASSGQTVVVTPKANYVAGSALLYDATTNSAILLTARGDGSFSFTMPAHAVQMTCLSHPDDGKIIVGSCATSTAGAGSAYARSNHPDVFSFDIPDADSLFAQCVYTHPYKAHNYNRKNLTLVCPDGYEMSIQDTYNQPWNVGIHYIAGSSNLFTITNEHTNGIDYWANGIATRADELTYITLSGKRTPSGIAHHQTDNGSSDAILYDLQGRKVIQETNKGIVIKNHKLHFNY